jgi:hypothetical protein
MRDAVNWAYEGETKTAILHGVVALLLGSLAGLAGESTWQFIATLVIGAFLYRETSDLVNAWRHEEDMMEAATDGAKDWLYPGVGLALSYLSLVIF